MTKAQKRLRELRERQSKDRGRMAELSVLDDLSDEQRSELDGIEKGTPDLERQIRAATVAVEDEEKAAETSKANEPDAELRERRDLRERASLTEYLLARMQGRLVQGPEAELTAAAETRDGAIPLELWDTPETIERRQTDTVSGAPGTVGVNLDRIRPAVFANSIAPRLGIEMPRVMFWHVCQRDDLHQLDGNGRGQEWPCGCDGRSLHRDECHAEKDQRTTRHRHRRRGRGRARKLRIDLA